MFMLTFLLKVLIIRVTKGKLDTMVGTCALNVHGISFSNIACHSEATSLCPPTNLLLDQSGQGRPQFA